MQHLTKCLSLIIFLISISVLIVCGNKNKSSDYTINTFGSLELVIYHSHNKDIVPDLKIAYCNITGTGPNGATFKREKVSTEIKLNNLNIGPWAIGVIAFNSDDQVIGIGELTTEIIYNDIVSETIIIFPKEGNGVFILTVSWPENRLIDPHVKGSFLEDDTVIFEFFVSDTPVNGMLTASCTNSDIKQGFYTLKLELLEGETAVWSNIEGVRILADETAKGNIVVTDEQINQLTGGLNLSITGQLNYPIDITLTGHEPVIQKRSDMTVTAGTSESVDSYQWYLNGSPISGQSSDSITFGGSLDEGVYTLALRVEKGDVISTKGFSFIIECDPKPCVQNSCMPDDHCLLYCE